MKIVPRISRFLHLLLFVTKNLNAFDYALVDMARAEPNSIQTLSEQAQRVVTLANLFDSNMELLFVSP